MVSQDSLHLPHHYTVGCEVSALTFKKELAGARGLEACAAGQDHRADSCSATHGSIIKTTPHSGVVVELL
jgi:hypothetical protein